MHAASPPSAARPLASHAPLGPRAFVVVVAALMAMNALAIDVMLPALPHIAAELGAAVGNDQQKVVTAYLIGFGLGQFVMGPLSDRFGRRPVLLWGLAAYAVAAVLCALAGNFEMLLAARFAQGIGSAAPRVVVTALVRDCYEGRAMARVMSLVMMTFMVVPVIAPSVGQAILLAGPWRVIFAVLAIYAVVLLGVTALRLPETLPRPWRRPLSPSGLLASLRLVVGSRQTLGYAMAAGVFFGSLFGFIASAQQILAELYGLGERFPLVFALIAASMAVAAFINSRLVEGLGMRLLSHGALAAFTTLSLALTALALAGQPPLWAFIALLTATMMLAGLVFSNFNALAMAPQAQAAGVAASFIGGFTTLLGATIGFVIARGYDGTVLPISAGYAACGAGALLVVAITERGRLFSRG